MQNEKGREKERGGEKSGKYRERIEGDKERGLKKKKKQLKRECHQKKSFLKIIKTYICQVCGMFTFEII